jgi:hypothetical protein
MKKFEYEVYDKLGAIALIDWLDDYGRRGWELCGVINNLDSPTTFIFKREITE